MGIFDYRRNYKPFEYPEVTDFTDAINKSFWVHSEVDFTDDKYRCLFSVDSINNLIEKGSSFREAYKIIGKQIQQDIYKPDRTKKHTHKGSIHNLCLDEIKNKFLKALD